MVCRSRLLAIACCSLLVMPMFCVGVVNVVFDCFCGW